MANRPFSWDDHTQKQLDPLFLAKQRVALLFHELKAVFGEEKTRHIFEVFGKPSARRLKELEHELVRDRLDLMGPHGGGPNIKRLARQLAGEKRVNPTVDEIASEERQIHRLLKKRDADPRSPRRGKRG
jgi:hypothetical protein